MLCKVRDRQKAELVARDAAEGGAFIRGSQGRGASRDAGNYHRRVSGRAVGAGCPSFQSFGIATYSGCNQVTTPFPTAGSRGFGENANRWLWAGHCAGCHDARILHEYYCGCCVLLNRPMHFWSVVAKGRRGAGVAHGASHLHYAAGKVVQAADDPASFGIPTRRRHLGAAQILAGLIKRPLILVPSSCLHPVHFPALTCRNDRSQRFTRPQTRRESPARHRGRIQSQRNMPWTMRWANLRTDGRMSTRATKKSWMLRPERLRTVCTPTERTLRSIFTSACRYGRGR